MTFPSKVIHNNNVHVCVGWCWWWGGGKYGGKTVDILAYFVIMNFAIMGLILVWFTEFAYVKKGF